MNFREATQDDLNFMVENSVSLRHKSNDPERLDYIYTLESEDGILAVGGFKMMNKTTAWCWMDWTRLAKTYPKASYKVVKEWMDIWVENMEVKRLMAAVRTDFLEGIRTIEHLGFHRESILKSFFGDKDAYMYARLR